MQIDHGQIEAAIFAATTTATRLLAVRLQIAEQALFRLIVVGLVAAVEHARIVLLMMRTRSNGGARVRLRHINFNIARPRPATATFRSGGGGRRVRFVVVFGARCVQTVEFAFGVEQTLGLGGQTRERVHACHVICHFCGQLRKIRCWRLFRTEMSYINIHEKRLRVTFF